MFTHANRPPVLAVDTLPSMLASDCSLVMLADDGSLSVLSSSVACDSVSLVVERVLVD
ncbi:hypothetical protein [Halorussus salinus]|uniref:hypothetical protein n=1 Tax=Halorussus salinus TaxID=1364935 RepID=UPI00138F5F75|nr:hypothetical protein [Halorussus salinus]